MTPRSSERCPRGFTLPRAERALDQFQRLPDVERGELLGAAGDDEAQALLVVLDPPVDERAAGALDRDEFAQPPDRVVGPGVVHDAPGLGAFDVQGVLVVEGAPALDLVPASTGRECAGDWEAAQWSDAVHGLSRRAATASTTFQLIVIATTIRIRRRRTAVRSGAGRTAVTGGSRRRGIREPSTPGRGTARSRRRPASRPPAT